MLALTLMYVTVSRCWHILSLTGTDFDIDVGIDLDVRHCFQVLKYSQSDWKRLWHWCWHWLRCTSLFPGVETFSVWLEPTLTLMLALTLMYVTVFRCWNILSLTGNDFDIDVGIDLDVLKALTSTKWGKQKETIVATYKAITRPILEYASTIWSPIASTTGITKLQTIQNMALRIATGCTSDTNIQHLHNETNILPLNAHLKLHSSQLRQKSQHPTHPLHKFTVLTENERHKKQTIFDNNNNYTVNINTKSDLICEDLIQSNLKLIHSHIVSNHLSQRPPNKVLQDQTPSVSPAELLLSRETRRTLAQLRTNKSPLLVSYLFSIGDPRHPSPLCPLCLMHDHTSSHLFECKSLPTALSSLDLWTNPDKVESFLATWGERLLAATWFRVLDSAGSTLVEWGRQQQQQQLRCMSLFPGVEIYSVWL